METTIKKREKIQDFGQKIGGAKKDLANNTIQRLSLITDDTLTVQPLSKAFPRPDFQRIYREGQVAAESAIRMQYLYNVIPNKPRSGYRSISAWVKKVKPIIEFIKMGLQDDSVTESAEFLQKDEKFINFKREMESANWPEEDYNPHPFRLVFPHQFSKNNKIIVATGRYIKFESLLLSECVQWIKENTNSNTKTTRKMEFSIWRNHTQKISYITPKGKKGIRLKTFETSEEANTYRAVHYDTLVKLYNELRNIHQGRRDWNRPRIGNNYRNSSDMTTEQFAADFPFRGVEFGNWVKQIERAAILNEAYDAFSDLANILGITFSRVTLDKTLAAAFGARGSGNAAAHYEHCFKVFNLTKKKGAGNVAHEWFHALDNYIFTLQGSSLSYGTESPSKLDDKEIASCLIALLEAIDKLDYKKRSEKIDEFKSKKYWSLDVELTARAFETYVISKLAQKGYTNDYLANVMTYDEYPMKDVYPYPTDLEMLVLMPYYDKLMESIFHPEIAKEKLTA